MRRLTYILSFLLITPLTIASSLLLLFSRQTVLTPSPPQVLAATADTPNLIQAPLPGVKIYAALPPQASTILGQPLLQDARTEIVRQYLAKYTSPLEPYAPKIVTAADRYGLDFRLLTAIAQQESNLCKKIPSDSYNCWGWGIHSQGTLKFSSYEEAIDLVSRGLKQDYVDQGYATPEQIMAKYTPLSNGSWAEAVNQFLQEME